MAWTGASFYASGVWIHGGQPSRASGDAQGVSNISAPPAAQLEELWLQQNLASIAASGLIGLFDPSREFYRLQASGLFLNRSFGTGPEFSQSGSAGPGVFPNTSLGVRLAYKPDPRLLLRGALLDGAPLRRPNGSLAAFQPGDGALLLFEVALLQRAFAPMQRSQRSRLGRFSSLPPYDHKLAFGAKPEDCSVAERDGIFSYRTGDLSVRAEHLPTGSDPVARLGLASKGESTMAAPGGTFGTFRLGHDQPGNDSLSMELVSTSEGIRVAFSRVFDARAAIAVSTLSDALRADLPDWLADEIFDLTFGGDPKPSLLIPRRAACAVDPKPVYRRLVEVEAGTVHGVVGAGRDESATAGQCLGQTRRPKGDLNFTSDWVEVLTCE